MFSIELKLISIELKKIIEHTKQQKEDEKFQKFSEQISCSSNQIGNFLNFIKLVNYIIHENIVTVSKSIVLCKKRSVLLLILV